MNTTLWLLIAFAIKHFICDFPLQSTPYMYANKGNLVHPGGYIHAAIHAFGTFICLALVVPSVVMSTALLLCLTDFAAHYLIDFSKVNIGKSFYLKPDNSEWFWILLGFDQLLHSLTYIAITYFLVSHVPAPF